MPASVSQIIYFNESEGFLIDLLKKDAFLKKMHPTFRNIVLKASLFWDIN